MQIQSINNVNNNHKKKNVNFEAAKVSNETLDQLRKVLPYVCDPNFRHQNMFPAEARTPEALFYCIPNPGQKGSFIILSKAETKKVQASLQRAYQNNSKTTQLAWKQLQQIIKSAKTLEQKALDALIKKLTQAIKNIDLAEEALGNARDSAEQKKIQTYKRKVKAATTNYLNALEAFDGQIHVNTIDNTKK